MGNSMPDNAKQPHLHRLPLNWRAALSISENGRVQAIGRYQIKGRIGSGSFATVYRGEDESLDVPVAVKVLSDRWLNNADVSGRFLAEARLLRRITDERIVRVYDIGTTAQGQPYFVMDLANGGSLEAMRKRLVTPGLALRLAAEASRALEVLHRNQLVHRDVTPGNILLNNTSAGVRVMLADLGVAKSLLDEQRDTMTAGTPAYMAPEQARSTELDPRSDVYSMAAVSYALLTGHSPFPAKTLQDLLARNPSLGPPPVAAQIGAPELLDEVMRAALSADPERRPQTALELAEALDKFADNMPGGDSYRPRSIHEGATVLRPTAPDHTTDFHNTKSISSSQTPTNMLNSYLGQGKYQPKQSKESHPIWFYLAFAAAAVGIVILTIWVAIYFLSG